MNDNDAKDDKIQELEKRIAALEERPVTTEPGVTDQPVKIKGAKSEKSKITARISYICKRIDAGKNVSAECYKDIKKYTDYNCGDSEEVVKARRGKILDAMKEIMEEEELKNDDETFNRVLHKIKEMEN